MVSRNSQRNGAVRACRRRAVEAESLVSELFPHRTEPGELDDAKMGHLLRKDYDWSKDVAAIRAPTMLIFGDADSVPPGHVVESFELLGGGKKDGGWDGSGISNARLAILPGLTHYNIFASPALVPTVLPFLDARKAGAQ
jgi:pimeloyl-ACP methyl ester carboxylesterase